MGLPFLCWGDSFDDFDDQVPQLLVLFFNKEDHTGGKRGECGGDILQGTFENLFQLGVWNGRFRRKLVGAAAVFDGFCPTFERGHTWRL